MSDIDVEPVDDVDESAESAAEEADEADSATGDSSDGSEPADAPEYPAEALDADRLPPVASDTPEFVLYGGKGGVGKTTMAAATGLSSAAAGTRTLVVSTDPAHSLSDTYEAEIGPEPTQIRADLPLYAAEIDPDAAMNEGMSMFGDAGGMGGAGGGPGGAEGAGGGAGPGGDPAAGDPSAGNPFGGEGAGSQAGGMGGLGAMMGGGNPLQSMLGGTMPGSDEAVAMQQLVEFMDDDRFDRVVVDTAPTGHTLRLLELPELMDTMVGRILSMRERISGLFDGLGGMFGGEEADPEAGTENLRELSDRIERLRETLTDPALTDFRIVMVPEELSVIESERLLRQLDDFSIPVETVVVNKVMEDLADVTDDVPTDDVVTPDLEHCEFCQRRWDVQQRALTRAQEVFRGRTIKRVPLLADEVRGERTLRVVAACLE